MHSQVAIEIQERLSAAEARAETAERRVEAAEAAQAALSQQLDEQQRLLQRQRDALKRAQRSREQLITAGAAEVARWAGRAALNWELASAVANDCDAARQQVRPPATSVRATHPSPAEQTLVHLFARCACRCWWRS